MFVEKSNSSYDLNYAGCQNFSDSVVPENIHTPYGRF